MTKTLEKKLNNLTLEELFIIAQDLDSSFWTYKELKNLAIDNIKDDDILVTTHILNALNNDPANYYNYDTSMGALEDVTPITSKEDFINFLKNYNDEDIKKILENYQGGF